MSAYCTTPKRTFYNGYSQMIHHCGASLKMIRHRGASLKMIRHCGASLKMIHHRGVSPSKQQTAGLIICRGTQQGLSLSTVT